MTQDQAERSAKALALAMGITFYVVRHRDGDFAAVQLPPEDSEIFATVRPPTSVHERGLEAGRDVQPPQSSPGFE